MPNNSSAFLLCIVGYALEYDAISFLKGIYILMNLVGYAFLKYRIQRYVVVFLPLTSEKCSESLKPEKLLRQSYFSISLFFCYSLQVFSKTVLTYSDIRLF